MNTHIGRIRHALVFSAFCLFVCAVAIPQGQAQVTESKQTAEQDQVSKQSEEDKKARVLELEKYEVQGSRVAPFGVGNVDLPRTANDAQAYYIFDSKTIERSGATSVEDLIRKRVPMDTNYAANNFGTVSPLGNTSSINLRGLGAGGTSGTSQTLILINGRRAGGLRLQDFTFQPDLNGIPLAAIERIEILPSTASAIYGGSAVGGVVNVVLRREYAGAELKATYENTAHGDAPIRSIDLTAGLSLEGGRTNLMLSASFSDSMPVYVQDRDFTRRGLDKILVNNPSILFAPPLGGTPNIKSQSGAPLFGPGTANFTSVPVGYAGGGGIAPLLANAGKYNLDRPATANFLGGGLLPFGLETQVKTFYATLSRQFTANLNMALELNHSKNHSIGTSDQFFNSFTLPASALNNPFGQTIQVVFPVNSGWAPAISDTTSQRAVGSFTLKLPHDWRMQGDYTYNLSRLAYSSGSSNFNFFGPISSGVVDIIKDTVAFPPDLKTYLARSRSSNFDSTLRNVALRVSGTLWELPAGPQTLTLGLEHTKESQPSGSVVVTYDYPPPNPSVFSFLGRSQSSRSFYVESLLPLIGKGNARPMVQELSIQVAGRGDQYDTGPASYSSINPTIGLRYKPVKDVLLRATYNNGFLAPSYVQLTPSTSAPFPTNVLDPRRGNTLTTGVLPLSGGNPDLKPETSTNWNVGVVLEPRFVEGLRISVDYFRIEKADNIATLSAQVIVNNESLFPGRVTRGAVPPGDAFGVGPISQVDVRYMNLTKTLTEGYDVALDYRKETPAHGTFTLYAIASFATHFKQQITLAAPYVEQVGKVWKDSPNKFRGNVSVDWEKGSWALGWSARYTDAYLQYNDFGFTGYILAQGSEKVPSQVYHDAFVRYRFANEDQQTAWSKRILSSLQVQVGLKNVFDAKPPFDAFAGSYYISPFGDIRLRSYYVSVKKTF